MKSTSSAAARGTGGAGPERIQKILAKAGIGSRRACEELILQGRVSVDGEVVRTLGTRVAPGARVEFDGEPVRQERSVYVAVNKPRGFVSTNSDPAGRPRVVDLVEGLAERVYTVGRLDEESTGLMILTNDGDMANRLAHPKFGVEKVYRALVAGRPTAETIETLLRGVWLSDGKTRARHARILGEQGDATLVEVVLAEGKNREVRRMWAKLGHKVMRLNRVAVGPISVKGLKVGQWRHLSPREVAQLRALARGERVETAMMPRDRLPSKPKRGPARHADAPTTPAAGDREPARAPRVKNAGEVPPPSQRRRAAVDRPLGPAARGDIEIRVTETAGVERRGRGKRAPAPEIRPPKIVGMPGGPGRRPLPGGGLGGPKRRPSGSLPPRRRPGGKQGNSDGD